MNNFTDDLTWSHAQADAPWWESVYQQAFPGFAGMRYVATDGWAQRSGIDRLVDLRDGTTLKIDEKCRRQDWGDILIEVWSDQERKRPGWILKDLTCDFIAYAFEPSETCYLLPIHQLKRAYQLNKWEWSRDCQRIEARNPGYTTVSVAVPIPVLLDAIRDAIVVHWAA